MGKVKIPSRRALSRGLFRRPKTPQAARIPKKKAKTVASKEVRKDIKSGDQSSSMYNPLTLIYKAKQTNPKTNSSYNKPKIDKRFLKELEERNLPQAVTKNLILRRNRIC